MVQMNTNVNSDEISFNCANTINGNRNSVKNNFLMIYFICKHFFQKKVQCWPKNFTSKKCLSLIALITVSALDLRTSNISDIFSE